MALKKSLIKTGRNLFKSHPTFYQESVEGQRAYRTEEVLTATVTVDGVTFDADEDSMDRMDRIVDIANWRYNQLVAKDKLDAEAAYNQVYMDTPIPWKTAHNVLETVSVETICKAQELALYQLSDVWVRYK